MSGLVSLCAVDSNSQPMSLLFNTSSSILHVTKLHVHCVPLNTSVHGSKNSHAFTCYRQAVVCTLLFSPDSCVYALILARQIHMCFLLPELCTRAYYVIGRQLCTCAYYRQASVHVFIIVRQVYSIYYRQTFVCMCVLPPNICMHVRVITKHLCAGLSLRVRLYLRFQRQLCHQFHFTMNKSKRLTITT